MAARKKKGARSKASSRKASGRKASTKFSADFSDVDVRITLPVGKYVASISEAAPVKKPGKDVYVAVKFKIESGDKSCNGQAAFLNLSTAPQAIWKMAKFLEALGFDVPREGIDLDAAEWVGEKLIISIGHREHGGNTVTDVVGFESVEDGTADPAVEGEGGGDDPLDADDLAEMDADELQEVIDDNDLEVDLSKFKTTKKKRAAVLEAIEAAGEPKKKGSSDDETYARSDVEKMDSDELQEVIDECELGEEVDLDDYKTTKKKRGAVIEALEEAELLED